MNREYIKDWVWEGRKINDGDQVYVTAKQMKKEATYIRNGLDFIITDSPLALTTFYGNIYDKYEKQFQACKQIVKQHHQFCKDNGYKVDHYFLIRTKEYNPAGRLQDEQTAKKYDEDIRTFLKEYGINFKEINCDDNCEESLVEDLLKNVTGNK